MTVKPANYATHSNTVHSTKDNWCEGAIAMIILRETLRYRHSDQLGAMEVPICVVDELMTALHSGDFGNLYNIMKARGYEVVRNRPMVRRDTEYALNDKDFVKRSG